MADIMYLDITNDDIEKYAKKLYCQISDIYISRDHNQLLSLIKGAVNTFDGKIASITNRRNNFDNITNEDLIKNLDDIIKYSEYYKNHLKGNNTTYTDSVRYCINAQLLFFISDITDLIFKNNRNIYEDSYDEMDICRNSVIETAVELYSEIISDTIEQSNDFCIDECIRLYKKVLIAYLASMTKIIDGYCSDDALVEFPLTLPITFLLKTKEDNMFDSMYDMSVNNPEINISSVIDNMLINTIQNLNDNFYSMDSVKVSDDIEWLDSLSMTLSKMYNQYNKLTEFYNCNKSVVEDICRNIKGFRECGRILYDSLENNKETLYINTNFQLSTEVMKQLTNLFVINFVGCCLCPAIRDGKTDTSYTEEFKAYVRGIIFAIIKNNAEVVMEVYYKELPKLPNSDAKSYNECDAVKLKDTILSAWIVPIISTFNANNPLR